MNASSTRRPVKKNTLTAEQLELLAKHDLDPNRVLIAYGWEPARRIATIEAGNYVAAVHGRSPCAKGHTVDLWTTKGHCILCYPQNVRQQRRFTERGHIYIAYSATLALVKIGIATQQTLEQRVKDLNKVSYGGASDWTVAISYFVEDAGRVESDLMARLKAYRTSSTYLKSSKTTTGKELFQCTVAIARRELDAMF